MSLGTLCRPGVSFLRKRGVALAAIAACAQLWSGNANATPATPSSLYSSCFPASIVGYPAYPYYYPETYVQWDASPYSGTDKMYFYFGVNVTNVATGAYPVQIEPWSSYSGAPRWQWAATNSDQFFPFKAPVGGGGETLPTYSDTDGYEVGCQAVDSASNASEISWIGVVKNT